MEKCSERASKSKFSGNCFINYEKTSDNFKSTFKDRSGRTTNVNIFLNVPSDKEQNYLPLSRLIIHERLQTKWHGWTLLMCAARSYMHSSSLEVQIVGDCRHPSCRPNKSFRKKEKRFRKKSSVFPYAC